MPDTVCYLCLENEKEKIWLHLCMLKFILFTLGLQHHLLRKVAVCAWCACRVGEKTMYAFA